MADSAFDAWVRRALDHAHAAILHEPVPERLLRALHQANPAR